MKSLQYIVYVYFEKKYKRIATCLTEEDARPVADSRAAGGQIAKVEYKGKLMYRVKGDEAHEGFEVTTS